MADVLIYADTFRSPELRHEVALGIPDPFLYAEKDGRKHIQIGSMEIPRLAELGEFELHPSEEFGVDELVAQRLRPPEIRDRILVRAVQSLGIERALVPESFPLHVANLLASEGIEVTPDREFFNDRRRVKNELELAGIRRAQRAAEAGMDAARDLLRRAKGNGGGLEVEGAPLTVERIKSAMSHAFVEHGTTADEFIVSHGPQSAIGHHMGWGAIQAGEPIVIDVWPRDNDSFCFADMTRTFVVGDVSDEVGEWHAVCKAALDRALGEIRAGADGRGIYDGTCEIVEQAGYPTGRTKEPGKPLEEGFFHGLGHGVGLEVHEQPGMGLASQNALRAGDVITIEPGLYRPGLGGLRLEDLVLVTESGAENLTDYPYDLAP